MRPFEADDTPDAPEAPVWLDAEQAAAWQSGWSSGLARSLQTTELLVRTDEALSLVGRFLDSHDRAAKPAACACVVCREARAWLHDARAAIAKAEGVAKFEAGGR